MSLICGAQDKEPPQRLEVRLSARPYAPAPPALRVETNLVEVGVVVRSHDGHAIPGLERENFVVTDQGQARELTYFAVETPGVRGEKTAAAGNAANPPAQVAVGGSEQPKSSSAAAPPRFIALYFEDFGTGGGDLKRAQIAGRRFVKEGLDDGDRVALFSTSGDFLDYTNDRAKLIAAIDKLKAHPKFSEAGLGGCPRISAYQAYEISVLFDPLALDAAAKEAEKCASDDSIAYTARSKSPDMNPETQRIKGQADLMWGQIRIASQTTLDAIGGAMRSLQNMPGRRLLLLVSSGFNSGTLELERDQLINRALRAGIVVNAVDAKGLYAEPTGRMDEPSSVRNTLPVETFRFEAEALNGRLFLVNQPLSDLAQATGGLFFHNNNDLPFGFRQLGSIPEVSYVLGFHRANASDGKYHKLKVSLVDTKSYAIQARPGYFAAAVAPVGGGKPSAPSAREKLDREVTGTTTLTDFAATVAFRQESAEQAGLRTVKAQIHIAIDKLQFPVRDERHAQQLRMVVALVDADGNVVAGKEGTMDFAMTDATYARLSASGINAGMNLEAPPGKYRLRAVVEEAVEGKMASSTVDVEVK